MTRMFYFGPWDRAGHYLHDERGNHVYRREQLGSFPWDEMSADHGIDGQLQPGCYKKFDHWRSGEQREGEALIHHKNGWTALCFWDRSVDTRGGCNSNYFAEGTFTFDEIVAMAKERFAYRWKKMPFQVVEVKAA
jgi:hypothetical protein